MPEKSSVDLSQRLGRRFFRCAPEILARKLLGRVVVRVIGGQAIAGRIVETEAYLGVPDLAAHSCRGRHTRRNHSMYLDGGHAYVYFTYGMHYCFNIVAESVDRPTACLIRALEPLEGLDRMKKHRSGKIPARRLRDTDLCSGPAKLCQALAIDGELDSEDLVVSPHLWIAGRRSAPPCRVVTDRRVGVAYAGEWADRPLRFLLADSRFVSVPPGRAG